VKARLGTLVTLIAVLVTLIAAPPTISAPALAMGAAPGAQRVSYDHYSVTIDGRRVLLRAAEFHYFRLPSPDLWRDVLEKYKAAGFNAVSMYFDWAYHSPKSGVYDFSGAGRGAYRHRQVAGLPGG
jgi:hypothetical protein